MVAHLIQPAPQCEYIPQADTIATPKSSTNSMGFMHTRVFRDAAVPDEKSEAMTSMARGEPRPLALLNEPYAEGIAVFLALVCLHSGNYDTNHSENTNNGQHEKPDQYETEQPGDDEVN